MAAHSITFTANGPGETTRIAHRIAPFLRTGDALLLTGPIGAGKTHFARALILSLLPVPEDVPSPTFTLVQTYQARQFEIWHFDLYRLSGPDEALELGLDEALETGLTLIEWPDRLAGFAPAHALSISFSPVNDGAARRISLSARDPRWAPLMRP